jgi:hypothetical protein
LVVNMSMNWVEREAVLKDFTIEILKLIILEKYKNWCILLY